MNEKIDRIIRDYAEGSLTGKALQEFELRLKNEPELQAELDLYLVLKATDNQRLKKQLLQLAATDQLTPKAPSGGLVRRLPLWFAVAASVALVLTAVWWWQQPAKNNAVQLAQTYISTPYPSPVATMGEADTRPAAVQRAFLMYRNGDFTAAARELAELSVAADANDETLFYAGEALLQTGQSERAIAHFERIRPGYWREIADWRRALALLKNGQTTLARPLLEKLRTSARRVQVEALLKAME